MYRNPVFRRNRGLRYSDPIPSYSNDEFYISPEEKDSHRAFFAKVKAELLAKTNKSRKPTERDGGKSEPEVPKEELAKKLKVKGVDFKIALNTKDHHTHMYDCTETREVNGVKVPAELVIRRGQAFKMTIKFDRPYNIEKNDITLIFKLGTESSGRKELKEVVKLAETKPSNVKKNKWSAHVLTKEDKSMTVSVFIPPNAPVGEWTLSIRTIVDTKGDKDEIWQYLHTKQVIVLFNPWCPDDVVYMEKEEWLNETVLNDAGCVYIGSARWNSAKSWFFGQFEDGILEISLHLLRKAFHYNSTKTLGYPYRVVRALSAIVNSCDDSGVLTGNWSGEYGNDVNPSTWQGSVKILEKYVENGNKSVKYGQCWVFSGVLTTVCRALGIPCRSVTNFASAHNSDLCHLSCDTINKKDSDGNWYEAGNDSCWNFHVWNEVWMARPDLKVDGKDYGGWQAIDATPQEKSDGIFQCGPSPLKAIKEGELNVGSDTAFIFAEVNGDKVNWVESPKGVLYVISRKKDAVGKNISTHKPTGKPLEEEKEVLIITDEYKYEEGSAKEREIVRKAEKLFRCSNNDDEDEDTPPPVVDTDVKLEIPDDVPLGKSVPIKLTAENKGKKPITVILSVDVMYVDYTDEIIESALTKKTAPIKLNPQEKRDISLEMGVEDTLKYPQHGFLFKVNGIMEIVELGGFPIKETETIYMAPPRFKITGQKFIKGGETAELVMKMTNPLNKPLTNCSLKFEGSVKPVDGVMETQVGTIKANETWSKKVKVKVGSKGSIFKSFQATLTSEELGPIGGYHAIILSKD